MNPILERPLPCNPDAERFVLGSILLDCAQYDLVAAAVTDDDFSLEKHRRIFRRMGELQDRGEKIDRVTVANELMKFGELEACDGLSYLVSLDDGLPRIPNLDSYVRIIKDKAILRRTIMECDSLIKQCMDASDDAISIVTRAEAVLSKLAAGQQQHGKWLRPGEIMLSHPGGINSFLQPPRGGEGLPTPWPRTTSCLCGLHRGDLVLVAGRPSMGKSIVGAQIGCYCAMQGQVAGFISLEMTKESLIRRLISAVGMVDAQRLRNGFLDKEERRRVAEAASQIDKIPLFIDDTKPRTIPALTSAVRKLMAEHPLRLLIVDHLQLMSGVGRSETRHHEFSEISHALKHLAGQLDITVVLLSQLNRECEKEARQPRLADLKETGSLEEDADAILFVHRLEQYKRNDPSLKGKAEFIIGKQRNGPTGMIPMLFQKEFQRFVEPAGTDCGQEE